MIFKDHYTTLQIPTTASPEEIKKAYRKLAHQYHPDKNDNLHNNLFHEIQEAYSVLSHDKKKKHYDEERYYAGLSSRKEPVSISSSWILKLAVELRTHTERMDSFRMNHQALYEYSLLIVSDAHIIVLQNENTPKINKKIVLELLQAVNKLKHRDISLLFQRLSLVAGTDMEIQQILLKEIQIRKIQTAFDKYLPWLVFIITIFLCFVMYYYSRK